MKDCEKSANNKRDEIIIRNIIDGNTFNLHNSLLSNDKWYTELIKLIRVTR